jgi:hypothetical protein
VAAGAVLFVPWIVYLAIELPTRVRTSHYDLMWVGFDVAMWAVLVGLAVAAVRRSTWTEPLAVCAATFLVLDAWFDIVTSDSREDLVGRCSLPAFIELPAAAVCAWIAHNAEVIRRRAYGPAVRLGHAPVVGRAGPRTRPLTSSAHDGGTVYGREVTNGKAALRRSPLHERHVDLGAKMADFRRWEMPIEYSSSGGGVVREHTASRSGWGSTSTSHTWARPLSAGSWPSISSTPD